MQSILQFFIRPAAYCSNAKVLCMRPYRIATLPRTVRATATA